MGGCSRQVDGGPWWQRIAQQNQHHVSFFYFAYLYFYVSGYVSTFRFKDRLSVSLRCLGYLYRLGSLWRLGL